MAYEFDLPSALTPLMAFMNGRFELVPLEIEGCPASFSMAIPIGAASNNSTESPRAGSGHEVWLPPALGPGQARIACGRGISKEQAILSCLGETAELVSASFWGTEQMISARMAELGPSAVHPNNLMLISDEQYRTRDQWNAVHGSHDWIPARFDRSQPIQWIEAGSLAGGARAYLPAAYAYIGLSGHLGAQKFCVGDSNGCASAPVESEAIVAGFLELVERDATAIWWYGRHRRPALDLDGLDDADFSALLYWHRGRGRVHHVLDITTDLGIPVFAAISANSDGRAVALGFGAHFIALKAAIAAFIEMLQLELSLATYRSQPTEIRDDTVSTWLSEVSFSSNPQLYPASKSRRHFNDHPGTLAAQASHGLDLCTAICQEHGLRLLTIDLTRPEIGVPVVRVIVPGLRHYRARFAPGRLFDVPVRLGWTDGRLSETDLNPTPLMI